MELAYYSYLSTLYTVILIYIQTTGFPALSYDVVITVENINWRFTVFQSVDSKYKTGLRELQTCSQWERSWDFHPHALCTGTPIWLTVFNLWINCPAITARFIFASAIYNRFQLFLFTCTCQLWLTATLRLATTHSIYEQRRLSDSLCYVVPPPSPSITFALCVRNILRYICLQSWPASVLHDQICSVI